MTILHTAHWRLHTAKCKLKTEHWTLHTANCTLNTEHRKLHTAHYTLYIKHCIFHTAHWPCKLQIVHCTLHTNHCKMHKKYNRLVKVSTLKLTHVLYGDFFSFISTNQVIALYLVWERIPYLVVFFIIFHNFSIYLVDRLVCAAHSLSGHCCSLTVSTDINTDCLT